MISDETQEQHQAPKAAASDGTTPSQGASAGTEFPGGQSPMPKPTFTTFVLSLASSALVHLGEVPDPATGKHMEDIALAKHSIDILNMLQDKIRTGLDKDEARLLEGLLYELRMKYVVKK